MLIRLENITKSFGSEKNRNLRKVLDGVSLEVSEGESIAILGPSGSGKTTLLNIIGSLDHPDSGLVFFKEQAVNSFNEQQRDSYRNKEIGFIFQFHHLLPQCNLFENVLIPTISLDNPVEKKLRFDRAIELMKRTGIYELRGQRPSQLSGGECQRAAVIRAMINSPSLLLADEPTGSLDSENAEKLTDLILELNKTDKITLIVVTHSSFLAARMETIYELKNGVLIRKNN